MRRQEAHCPGPGGAAETGGVAWMDHLVALYRRTRLAAQTAARQDLGTVNAKGDSVKAFDLAADQAAATGLANLGIPLIVESEEGHPRRFGGEEPAWRVIVDPVDGSDNWSRGLPLSAFSCAVLPSDAAIRPECVAAAIVGPLAEDAPMVAEIGLGAWLEGERIRTSGVAALGEAFVSVELNHASPSPGLRRITRAARGVRSYGCASMALALVARGATDAHIDARGRLTAESYLAGARLVLEAGGWVVGAGGEPVAAVSELTEGRSIVAAATRELAESIVDGLSDERR